MNRKIDIAWYVGDQELGPGHFEPLFNVIPREGLRDSLKNITYTQGSTITGQTLRRIVPNVKWPTPLKVHRDPTGSVPPSPESIAYAIV